MSQAAILHLPSDCKVVNPALLREMSTPNSLPQALGQFDHAIPANFALSALANGNKIIRQEVGRMLLKRL